jgi:hypothetical protein
MMNRVLCRCGDCNCEQPSGKHRDAYFLAESLSTRTYKRAKDPAKAGGQLRADERISGTFNKPIGISSRSSNLANEPLNPLVLIKR